MSFVDDERGRVPFALIAAVLLVSTLVYTGGLVHEAPDEPVAPRVVEGAVEDARLHLGTAAREAGREQARTPVLAAADTPVGELLADDPFGESLSLRVAVAVRDSLPLRRTGPDTAVTVSLPAIEDVATTERALEDVHLERLRGDRVRVTVEDARVVVRRRGRVLERDRTNLSTVVAIPALSLHDRMQTFEDRLGASVAHPGLAQALTLRLYALAWVRGYAQYGGAPISNVVANRHVGLLANDALVDQQAAVFGRADPDSRRGVARAAGQVAVADGVAGLEGAVTGAMTERTNASAREKAAMGAVSLPSTMDEPQSVGVDQAADTAFVDYVSNRWGGLDAALRRAYRADVRADSRVRYVGSAVSHGGSRPANATHLYTAHDRDYDVDGAGRSTGRGDRLATYDRRVTVTETATSYWFVNGTYAGATTETREHSYDVAVRVDCRYHRPRRAPGGRVAGDCPFGTVARSRLVERAGAAIRRFGGPDVLARRAVRGGGRTRWTTVGVEPPDRARDQAYRSAAALREEVRDVEVSAAPLSMASTANPASKLAETVRDRRRSFVDAPRPYGSAADVAATLARAGYLDGLTADLDGDSAAFARVQDALGDVLAEHAVPGSPPEESDDDLSGIASSVDADPRYLSLSAERGDPPLAARNLNVFTVPYGDAGDVVGDAVGGSEDSVSLATATSTLRATNDALATDPTTDLRAERSRLRRSIGASLDRVATDQRRALAGTDGVSRSEAAGAVRAGYDSFGSVEARASAVVDGTIGDAIAATLPAGRSDTARDRAAVELRVATVRARRAADVRPPESSVGRDSERVRTAIGNQAERATRIATKQAADAAKQRAFRGAASELPAGVPIVPIPGEWFATANVWVVSVQGGYERFAVTAPRATPAANGSVTYVREAAPVALDVDGDGRAERLGRNREVTLSADTGVLVVVPPGPPGVGDTDGNADERSPGW